MSDNEQTGVELTDEERAQLAELDEQLEKFEGQKRWSDVIKTVLAKAELHRDPDEKVRLYKEAGTLYVERSSNQAEAIKCFEQVLELAPEDLEAIERLKEMYEKRRDWESLIAVMGREAEMLDPADRAIRYVEMADLATQRIRKPEACIALWEKVRSYEPHHPQALEALSQLYERAREWEPLAQILETVVEADPDPKNLQKLGMIYGDKLNDDAGAVRAFKKLLVIDPDDRRAQEQLKRRYTTLKAWDELEEFYAESDKWDELIRIFERAAEEKEASDDEKIDLLFRAARLWTEKKDQPPRAARAYEKILEIDADNLRAAEALSPIYEEANDARKLAPVYEVRLRHDMEPEARVALLRELGLLYEERLRQADVALDRYLDAFATMPQQEIVREDVDRLAAATGAWDKVIEAYGTAIEGATTEDDAIELRISFGGVLRKVDKIDEAIAQFRAVYEARGDHAEAIAALAELYAATERFEELLGIYDTRMELEPDAGTRRGIAYQRAALIEEKLADADRAIDAYAAILAEYGEDETDAFRSLDRLYEGQSRWQDLADTLERRIDLGPESTEELAALKFRLARALEQHLGDKPRAVDLYREVLTLLPEHDGARLALEALLDDAEVAVAAARILEPIYEMQGSHAPLIRALRVLHDGSSDADERLELLTKIAEVQGGLEDNDAAFAAYAEALSEQPGSADTLQRLETLAITDGRFPQLVALLAKLAADVTDVELRRALWLKTAQLQEAQLEDVDGAVGSYRKILEEDAGDLEALLALDALFRRTERWADLVVVLRSRADQASDPEEKEELLAQTAAIYDEYLEDPATAIGVYNEILELDPASPRALGALDDLFGRQGMWAELADNVSRQLELADDEDQQIRLMLRLASLRETRMEAVEVAIEIYRDVLLREPTNPEAQANLERLLAVDAHQLVIAEILEPIYRDAGEVPKLIGVHEIQARLASSPERRVELLHRIAELYEVALDDYPNAFESFARALAEDPANLATQEQLERLAPAVGDLEALAKVYEERVEGLEDPALAALLLVKAAQIREEQLQDFEQAIAHYQRVLSLDDQHLEAATALERLYQLNERWEELATIYLTKARMMPTVEERKEHLHRAAQIYEELLERPTDSITVYHMALEADPEDLPSLDKLIELNLRLERWEDLLGVYTRKADIVADPDEKKRLYAEVGTVWERELNDHAKAIDSYQRILEIDPDDLAALGRLDQLYQATSAWRELLSVLEREADLSGDPLEVISFRFRIGNLYHRRLDDAERAIDIYRDVLEVAPDHAPTLDELEAMIAEGVEPVAAAGVLEPVYQQLGESAKLVNVHEVQIAHEADPLRKVELLHRVAELREIHLDDAAKAFDAYARSLPFDNGNEHTLGSLERLADQVDGWQRVTSLYDVEIRALREERPEDAIELAMRTAMLYEVQVGDVEAAINRYRLVVELDSMHVEAIEALDRLYEATERWAELADILDKEIQVAASPDDILTLQFRLGRLHQERLGQVEQAIERYADILGAAPEHQPAIQALEGLFSQGVEPLRIGEVLEPLYRMRESWDRLIGVHEVQLHYQGDQTERVSMMHRIAEIAEERAGDYDKAFFWMQRALLEDPSHDHSLMEVERLGAAQDGWEQLASTYADGIGLAAEPAHKLVLGKRLARVYEEELADVPRAEETYRYLLGVSDRDEDTLVALDRIYDENGANEALAQVLKKRIQATDMPQDLVDLHYRLGQVLENDLGRTEEAISVYQRVLGELEPEHAESVSALQEIYTRQKNWPALQAAFQKELDVVLGDTQRADIYAKMARLASDALSDFERAIELWREVLELRGEDPEALNALGNIFAQQERWAELVEVLEREANAVEHDEQRVAIYADLGRIWYERLGRERSALDSWERVLDLDPSNTDALFHIAEIHRASGQHHDLVDTLHRVVEVGAATLDDATIENVYMQLGHLYNVELQQPLDAAEAYTKAIDVNPRAFDAMDALEHIYRTESMWEDAVGVMEKRVLAFDEPERKIGQLLTIAKTWAEQLANADGGTSAFQRILELEPLHEYAFERVEALHRAAGRWDELIDAYVVRVESVEDLDVSVKLLRKTAKVYEEKLGDLDQAFDALQVAWSLDYGNDKTLEELTRVTRSAGKWNELLTAANEALQEAEDQDTKIILCLQCAKWYGQELDHPDYALPYYQQVQAVDPGNVHLMVSMAELYEKTQQWDALAQTYGQIVSTSEEPKITADTYVKMGELSSTHLGMPEQAPGYYEKAIDVVATHLPALVHLERIYSERGQWQKLLDVMQRKVRGLEEPDEIIEAQLKLAELYEDRIGNVEEAITTYSAVRSRDALNLQALKGLERLYARAERWQELLEVLQVQYDVVSTEKERITILTQLAGMWEESFIKPDRAAECHERILEIDHTHEGALNALARLYRQMQQWERLVDTYERHVAATPDRGEKVRVLKALGDTFARDLDQQDRAVDSYLNVLSINDQDVEALDALTRIYDKRGDHVSALEMMEQLARLVQDPAKQVDLLFRSARILDQELGDRMSALDKYQMALDLDPGHLPSLGAMRAIQLDSGDWLAAAKLLEQEASYQKSPRVVAELLVELGQLYEERLDEHERAVQVWEAALKQDPDNEDAALPLVAEYRRTERYAEAFPLLEMLVKRSGKREPHEQHRLAFELGETASKLAKHEEAIKAFERAYQIDATHLPTVFGVANAYFAAAQWDKAFKFYQMILLHQKDILGDAENTDIYYRQGVIKREQGERRKALNLFDKALEFDAHHRPTLEAIVGLYQQSNDWQQVVHFKKIILESVYDEDERFSMLDDVGTLWEEKLANPQKAIECWVEASTLKPEDHRLLHKLLGAYQKTRDWEKTIETIEMISSLDERKTVRSKYAYTIGVILRDELKDADRALEKFSEALDLDVDQLKAFEAVNKILNARKDWKQLERAYRKMIHRVIGLEGREDLKYNLFYTLGIIYRDRQRNFEAAAEAFKTAASLKPDDPQQHQILAELYQAIPDKLDLAISEHQWLLQHDPYRVDSYRALYKLYFDARAYDKAWCLAATLAFLQKADAEQTQFYQQYKPQGPIRPRGRVERNLWFSELLHPGQDRYVTKIMELMAPPALAVKHASDKALKIDKLKPVDPASSTALFARTWGFVLQVLNIPTQPRLYLQQQAPGGLAHLPGSNPPAVISGSTLLSGYSPQDLMFVIGRFSTYYLTEHFVRTLFGSHTELRFLLLAALRLSGLGPADPQVDQWAQPLAGHMSPAQTDALRAVCRKFIDDQGGRADIKGWMQSVELSAIRAGFLVCNDLDVARRMIQALPPEGSVDLPPKDKLKELVLFSVSEQYFKLREALGIQIQV
ncbi:MAG: tetratricopeptide repeat protein [Myxococcales bacterium]|nr:tetratricopeptide repeat protein [Myxococcales bacterium]